VYALCTIVCLGFVVLERSIFHFLSHVDLGVSLRRSCLLAMDFHLHISPPLEREIDSPGGYSHIDSQRWEIVRMTIPTESSPPQEVGENDPTPDRSSLQIPSHSGYDPHSQVTRYWFLGDETHHEPTSTSHVFV